MGMKSTFLKITALLMAVICMIGVVGCANRQNESSDQSTSTTSDDFMEFPDATTEPSTEATTGESSGSGDNTTDPSRAPTTTAIPGAKFPWPKLSFTSKKLKIINWHEFEPQLVDLLKKQYGLEIELNNVGWFGAQQGLAAAIMAGSPPDAVFIKWNLLDYYSFLFKDMIQPIDKYMDWTNPIYKEMSWFYGKLKHKGKNYVLIRTVHWPVVAYNKKIFRDSGVEDLWEIYKKGEWTWDKLKEIGPKLARDPSGAANRMAMNTAFGEAFVYTTGQTCGKIDFDAKKPVSNMRNADIARAVNFLIDGNKNNWILFGEGSILRGGEYFRNELIAMWFAENYGSLYQQDVEAIARRGDLGLVPYPRDPKKDKLYYYSTVHGFAIPKGAENPNAAVALEACITYLRQSQEGQKTRIDKYKNELHFTDLNIQQLYETQKVGVPVLDLAPFLGEGAFYDVICNNVSWLTALANDEPKVQEKLESMFRTSIQ